MHTARQHPLAPVFGLVLLCLTLVAAPLRPALAQSEEDLALLDRSAKAFSSVVKKAGPAVVHVAVEKTAKSMEQFPSELFADPFFERFFGPQAQGIDGGAHVAVAGEDDDAGLRRQFLGRLEHTETVQPGHHQVGDHQVELHRAQGGDCLAAVRRGGDREMLRLQLPGEGCADDLFVIDKENGCLGHGSPRQSAGTRAGAPVRGLRSFLSRGS